MAKTDYEFDTKGLKAAQEWGERAWSANGTTRKIIEEMEDAYFLDWKYDPPYDEIKKTVSPDGRNKVAGGVSLLTATVPQFKVPHEKNNTDAEQTASRMEKLAGIMWARSNHIQGVKTERDLALMAFMTDKMVLQIIQTKDILEVMQEGLKNTSGKFEKKRWEGRVKRAEENAKQTPYLFEAVYAKAVVEEQGRNGLEMTYTEIERTATEVLSQWGERAREQLSGKKPDAKVTVCEMFDLTFRYVWLKEKKERPIYAEPHGLPRIPIVVRRVKGSRIFEKPERRVEPFLYSYVRSGLYATQNRIYTALNTNLAAGLNAQFTFSKANLEDQLEIDHTQILGVVKLPPGSKLDPLLKDILSKDAIGMLNIVNGMTDESTLYDQALGGMVTGNDTYSTLALLSQAGRLPIIPVQIMLGELLAEGMETAFCWMREDGGSTKTSEKYGKDLELKASEIPEALEFKVTVDVDLPQDKLQAANISTTLTEKGLASREWAQSNFLNIENPEAMEREMFKEQARRQAAGLILQKMLVALEQTGTGTPPPPVQAGAGAGAGARPNPGPSQEGGMMAGARGGLPNVMMAGGGQGPQQPNPEQGGELPPEMTTGGQ